MHLSLFGLSVSQIVFGGFFVVLISYIGFECLFFVCHWNAIYRLPAHLQFNIFIYFKIQERSTKTNRWNECELTAQLTRWWVKKLRHLNSQWKNKAFYPSTIVSFTKHKRQTTRHATKNNGNAWISVITVLNVHKMGKLI